ncbi:MAG: hypothetical protein JRI38_07435 [Deltaproteobacteria bacterium]|nr:hypothetical protein [Deltaproteobacteria bacterium]
MSFKENLLKKINIDHTVQKVLNSIGPVGGELRIDKQCMRSLLETAAYEFRHVRDLDLYIQSHGPGKGRILVLDNDLAIYDTSIEDVAMRKSPTVKEMISIKNAIRILNDKDVVISKKEQSLKTVQSLCIAGLDLGFKPADIQALAAEGIASLENGYPEGVMESMDLFAELLGYSPPPKSLRISHCRIIGGLHRSETGEAKFGPMVVYSRVRNSLVLLERQLNPRDPKDLTYMKETVALAPDASGKDSRVFEYLAATVLKSGPASPSE